MEGAEQHPESRDPTLGELEQLERRANAGDEAAERELAPHREKMRRLLADVSATLAKAGLIQNAGVINDAAKMASMLQDPNIVRAAEAIRKVESLKNEVGWAQQQVYPVVTLSPDAEDASLDERVREFEQDRRREAEDRTAAVERDARMVEAMENTRDLMLEQMRRATDAEKREHRWRLATLALSLVVPILLAVLFGM